VPARTESSLSYVTTDGQPASLSWNKAPIWGLQPDFYYCLTVADLLILGALSDERTGLSFTIAAGHLVLLITSRHGPRRKHLSSIAVQLLVSGGMTYSTVVYVAIGKDRAENTVLLLLFSGRCLVTAVCFDSTILALSEYAAESFQRSILRIYKMHSEHVEVYQLMKTKNISVGYSATDFESI
jgi:hypothetical protein